MCCRSTAAIRFLIFFMIRRFGRKFTAAFAATAVAVPGCVSAVAQEREATMPCGGEQIALVSVKRAIDGRTLGLDDGREVRLAAIEVPPLPAANETGPAEGAVLAKEALDALTAGDEVLLRRAEIATDRYGRLVAYAYTVREGSQFFVQGEMIAAGLAQVGDRIGSQSCANDLLGREGRARGSKLGLWANSYYRMLSADDPAKLLAQRGQFALVEGKVASVRESGATIYVNFGRRWSEDFAVTIPKRNEHNFITAGFDPRQLAGHRVRVRGWIERGGGGQSPRIDAAQPAQIEFADRE
jgi:endonuclease YncB( thermonuclease family)